jgi:RNA polymerase sigma-70 factor (ECF subfamily)
MGLSEQDLKTLLATDLNTNFPAFVRAYESRVFAYVWYLLRQWQDAEDVAQQTFINAYRALLNFSWLQLEELALESWLFTIARNLSFNHRSRIGARQSQVISLEQLRECEQSDEKTDRSYPSPEATVEQKESREELYRYIGLLSEQHRETLLLHYIAGLSYPQIALILKNPLNTVKSNGRRGFKQLKQIIQANYVKEEVKE